MDTQSTEAMQAVIFGAMKESVGPVFERILKDTIEKRPSYARNKNMIKEMLGDAITEEVRKAVKNLVDERRDDIQTAARAAFEQQRDTIVDKFIAKATENLTANVVVSLTVDDKRGWGT